MGEMITIQTTVNVPVEHVWNFWTKAEHIMRWNNASDDWHTTRAENDLRKAGRFLARMEAKDGSMGFDFSGIYDNVILHQRIEYTLDDGRKVRIDFTPNAAGTTVVESFEAEKENPADMQRTGWQAILDNFKNYCEQRSTSWK